MRSPTLSRSRILLVEDSASQAMLIRLMLEAAGYEVFVAEDGDAAILALEAGRFATVITDLQMESVDGSALLDHIRKDDRLRSLPVIALSASQDEGDMAAAIERGAVDYLIKPVHQALLLARVRTSVERKRMADRESDYLRLVDLERRRAELLLYDLLPAEIAARLKRGDQVIADAHHAVTVLFADLVGFTAYADGRPPQEVVRCLDQLFSRFDELVVSYGVEKIKTLGDGYMAASGLPSARADHAAAAADVALAMREVVRDYQTEAGVRFHLRIGMASGPVVAGVIGARRHVYDLWGDTVNVASRMEATAPSDGIQIDATTAAALGGDFEVQALGLVEVKGKAAMEASLLISRRVGVRAAKRASFARTASFEARRALELAERATAEMELIDARSGLLSARGFLPLLEAMWRTSVQELRGVLCLRVHLEHPEQDGAVARLASGLRATFRDTDLLVRWDDHTFAMVGLERSVTNPDVLQARLRERLATHDQGEPLALSCASVRLIPAPGENEHRLIQVLDGALQDGAST